MTALVTPVPSTSCGVLLGGQATTPVVAAASTCAASVACGPTLLQLLCQVGQQKANTNELRISQAAQPTTAPTLEQAHRCADPATTSEMQESIGDALIKELCNAAGAIVAVEARPRSADGVRGLFALRDLTAGEKACWVPEEVVLSETTCGSSELRQAIDAAESRSRKKRVGADIEGERDVRVRLAALVLGYLLERRRGAASRFHAYLESLPAPPPTRQTLGEAEREALLVMIGGAEHDCALQQLCADIVALASACPEHLWTVGASCSIAESSESVSARLPSQEEVQTAFYFVLTRMSHMRLIPICDFANAALPGQDNARILVEDQIVNGRRGCALVTKRLVKAGEEVVIDYSHVDGPSMLLAYGCSLGLEKRCAVTRVLLGLPSWIREAAQHRTIAPLVKELGFEDPLLWARGAGFAEEEPEGLDSRALSILELAAAFSSVEEILAAARGGWMFDLSKNPAKEHADVKERCRRAFTEIADFCHERLQRWEALVGRCVLRVDLASLAGSVAVAQHETELRLLRRCEQSMRKRASACSQPSLM
eukprot:TRINITY_DN49430_c0_g1_i1.p1 TRINITY_DN49430_c0_g1~~TRINITY_DN49430_c0_g1_i1.p1  ORF type:complete len:583 (-),score=108.73 TRINITY_DN49430_c0_g1_i1:187-1812(-)